MRKLITLEDLTHAEIERIFAIADDLKSKFAKGVREALLPGRVMALLFEKPSLRTRVSFETSIVHLGGSSLFLGQDVGWGAAKARLTSGACCRSMSTSSWFARTRTSAWSTWPSTAPARSSMA